MNTSSYMKKDDAIKLFLQQQQRLKELERANQILREQLAPCEKFFLPMVDDSFNVQNNTQPVVSQPDSSDVTPSPPSKRYWTTEEHIRFLKAITWLKCTSTKHLPVKVISEFVGSRTPTQVRTHAQKYFDAEEKGAVCVFVSIASYSLEGWLP